MFLVNLGGLLSGGSSGAGGIGNVIRLSGGGGRGAGGAMGFLGDVTSTISEAAANYNPEPPPPRSHFSNIEANESEEVWWFRRLFAQLAGDDMEVSACELVNALNKVVTGHPDLKTDGFGINTCRSMVAIMDSDTSGKLGFKEFKYLWNNIKKWQAIYKQYDLDHPGTIGSSELSGAFLAVGFQLSSELYQMIIQRYSDEDGNMDFDNFISCLVCLDAMFRAFKARSGQG